MSQHIDHLLQHYPELAPVVPQIDAAVEAILTMHKNGGKLLLCGNGGSAADSDHISGELLKGFLLRRPMPADERKAFGADMEVTAHLDEFQRGVCALPLPQLAAVLSAYANDVNPTMVFAQLVYAAGRKNDVFLGLSTSGNSKNVVLAAETAKSLGFFTIGMTGEGGGKLANICDVVIKVPSKETYRIQEYHLPIYHAICAEVESALFGL